MRKILFVDDEMLVLAGLQRLLRPMRHEWEIALVNSGQAALEKLQSESFDILVTDMKMPGMTGINLLTEVRERYPQIVRLALSGYSDENLTLQSVNLAHQYLSKPCEPEVLKQTLQRICAQRDLLTNEALQRLVSQLPSLPVLPGLYFQLTRELDAPDVSLERIGQLIAQDVGMTAKLLQIANSAFFGLKREVSNPKDAALYLGVETLRSLVLSLHMFTQFRPAQNLRLKHEALWSHVMQVGQLAKRIAQSEQQPQSLCNAAFTAGLLHEVGHLILATKLPQQYAETVALAEQEAIPLVEAEQHVFGVGHPEVGAYLLGLWGLPDAIVEAVAFHHEPSRGPASTTFTALTAVHVADSLLGEPQVTEQSIAQDTPLDRVYVDELGLGKRITLWQESLTSQKAD